MARLLGKQPAVFDAALPLAKTLKLLAPDAKYLPSTIDWSKPVTSVPMLGNDKAGDCTIATSLHFIQFITANAGTMEVPDADCAIDNYSRLTGYNPISGQPDNGAVINDKNRFWMQNGFAISDNGALDKLDGYAQIEAGDIAGLLRALATFGPIELGVELPPDAEQAYESGQWTDTSGAYGGLGGHDTLIVASLDAGAWFKIATWDGYVMASMQWVKKYMSEGTALLRRKWLLQKTGLSPSGLTMAELDEAIAQQRGVLGLGA